MKLSMNGFSHGLPGVMKMVAHCRFANHRRTRLGERDLERAVLLAAGEKNREEG